MREVSEASQANEHSCRAATGCWDRQLAGSVSGARGPCAQAQRQTATSRILMRSSLSTPSQLVNGLVVRAMVLKAQRAPLELVEVADPKPGPGQILVRVRACGVCRTDLHVADGELREPKLPLILGHEIVGLNEDGRRDGFPCLGRPGGECAIVRGWVIKLCVRVC